MSSTRSRRRRLCLNDVLEAIDGNDSTFGSGDEDDNDDDDDWPELQTDSDRDDSSTTSASSDHDDQDDFDSEDDQPLQNLVKRPEAQKKNDGYTWQKIPFIPPDVSFTPAVYDITEVESPYTYFRLFFTSDMIELIVEQTNIYSVEKHGKSVNTNPKEIEQLFGIFFHMGIVQMPGVRVYWEN